MTGSPDAGGLHPLPLTVDGITAAWVTAALRTRDPDVTVTRVEQLEVIDGTATKVLVALEHGGSARDLPNRIWVKGGFAEHREYVGAMGVYAGEVRFFNDIAPTYELHRPASWFGVAQDDPVQGIVALEDLRARDVVFARATKPLTVDLAAAGLETLADLHGQSWGDERPAAAGVGVVMGSATDPIWQAWFDALPEFFAAPRAYAAPVGLHEPDRLRAAAVAYRASAQRDPACLVHGDAHMGNAYVERDGTVGFVDWQTIAIGHWVHDVNYFLVSALDVPDRRSHERELLDHYLKSLAAHDVSVPTPDEAWESYRTATVYGFLCWLCNPDIWQPADVNAATFARFGAALQEHDTYAALGV